MPDPFDPTPAALALLAAWREGSLLQTLDPAMRPDSLTQGYEVQEALLAASGAHRAGWKLGVGSPAQMRAAKLSRPLVGQLDGRRIHRSGTRIALPSTDPVTIECEIAFVLARDILPSPGRLPEAQDISQLLVSFEIVRSRFIDRRAVGWPSFVADNVGFEALVLSEPIDFGDDLPSAIRRINDSACVTLDGEPKARALAGEAATEPMASLSALFAHAAERGITLRRGELVSTGAMCQAFDIQGSGHSLCSTFEEGELAFDM